MVDDIYIIGCGMSMEGFDWESLRTFHTIAVNGAIMHVPEPDIFLTACSAFSVSAFRKNFWQTEAWKVLVMGVDHKRYSYVQPFIDRFDEVIAPCRYDGVVGFELSQFATGKNSGFCAMQYAVLCGARRIHLVGFDLGGHGHFYGGGGPNKNVLDVFYSHFVTGIAIIQQHGIEVINHTRKSRLEGILPYQELVHAETTGHSQPLHDQYPIPRGSGESSRQS